MNNLNSVLIEGNLVKDPELSYTSKGTPVCRITLACNRFYKQDDEYQKEVSYFDITVWSKQAEACNEYLSKGRGIRVVGRLKQDRWEDTSGNTRYKVQIVAEHVEFKPKPKEAEDSSEADQDDVGNEEMSLAEDKEEKEKLPI
jgi:single-strand DNA-binding protein